MAAVSSEAIERALDDLVKDLGDRFRETLLIPPDSTRSESRSGDLTRGLYARHQKLFGGKGRIELLPALGTHDPDRPEVVREFHGDLAWTKFHDHSWRENLHDFGDVPAAFVRKVSGGRLEYPIPVQVNRLIVEGGFGSILSIGQVVPHEVSGMANYTKNLVVGCGGMQGLNKTHFLGAVSNMETILGRTDNPVRAVFDYAQEHYLTGLPVTYLLTVVGRDAQGRNELKGLFVGKERETFERAAEMSRRENIILLDEPLQTAVVYLDPSHFKSTWLGNKSIYRTRMAMADGGTLIVLAPGVEKFGEDPTVGQLIRTRGGYCGTEKVLAHYAPEEVGEMGSAAAHQIHGSSEGRFRIVYCTDPAKLSEREVRGVGFDWADASQMLKQYNPETLREGMNPGGVFYVSNPALGLWALKDNFKEGR